MTKRRPKEGGEKAKRWVSEAGSCSREGQRSGRVCGVEATERTRVDLWPLCSLNSEGICHGSYVTVHSKLVPVCWTQSESEITMMKSVLRTRCKKIQTQTFITHLVTAGPTIITGILLISVQHRQVFSKSTFKSSRSTFLGNLLICSLAENQIGATLMSVCYIRSCCQQVFSVA